MKVAYEMAIYRIYVVEVRNREKYLHKFSQKYFTIWGRNMDTKHTTGEQITGN
jgi:hypothetical protein